MRIALRVNFRAVFLCLYIPYLGIFTVRFHKLRVAALFGDLTVFKVIRIIAALRPAPRSCLIHKLCKDRAIYLKKFCEGSMKS